MTMAKKIISLIVLILFFVLPGFADAHAILTEANPPPDAHLQKAPKDIKLTFNERLQNELYYIKVYDSDGKQVIGHKTQLSPDHTGISLKLPVLKDGTYTVSYHIISADGHPIDQSYLFSVGEAERSGSSGQTTAAGHGGHGGMQQALLYGAYYLIFLTTVGWVLFGVISPKRLIPGKRRWLRDLGYFFALICFLVGFAKAYDALNGIGLHQFGAFLFQTETGATAGLRFLLALMVPFVIGRWRILDAIWLLAIVAVEAVDGHALLFHPAAVSVIIDGIHLLMAAFWVGGLFYIALHWKRQKDQLIQSFLPYFSDGAFISIVGLAITGLISTVLLLPDPTEMLHSNWGRLLIIKVMLVLLVVIAAGLMRRYLGSKRLRRFIQGFKIDFILMIMILLVVGILTETSPFPQNEPLTWRAKSDGFQISTTITPNNPGAINTFRVELSSHNHQVQNVRLILNNEDGKTIGPLDVPLQKIGNETRRDKRVYQATGKYLMFPGNWKIDLYIMDEHDNEYVLSHKETVYRVGQP